MSGSHLYNTVCGLVCELATRALAGAILLFCCLDVQAGPEIPDTLQTLLDRAATDSARIRAHIRVANALITTDYTKALEHATRAVQLSEKASDHAAMIETYKIAATICVYKGLFDLATQFVNRHYELAKKDGDEIEAGMAYFNLGSVQMAMADYGKAREYLNDAYGMLTAGYKKSGQDLPMATALTYRMNLAIIFMYLDEFKRADSMLNISMSMVQDQPDREARLMTIHHLRALLFLKTKNPKGALEALTLSRPLALRLHNMPAVAATYISEAQAFEQLNNFTSAKKSYTEALGYADQYNGLSDRASISECLYKIYRKSGPSDSMVKYFEMSTDLRQQSKAQQAKEELMRTELKRSYDRMVEDLEHQQQGAKRQYLFLTVTLLLASIAATATYIRYRSRNQKMRFERIRRDLEVRKAEYEQLRLQAELGDRDAELDRVKRELEKYSLIEGLVGSLDSIKQTKVSNKSDTKDSGKANPSDIRQKAWEEFELRFLQMHSGFYDRLNQRYPNLRMNERRLCAFLLLDMSTKEISDITGQSVTALNMARIRLRSKLGLTHTDKELYTFLSEL